MTMWQEIEGVVPDVSILRRLLFAVTQLSKDTPNYYSIICEFAFQEIFKNVDQEKVRVLVENIHFMNAKAFATDQALSDELKQFSTDSKLPVGVVQFHHSKCVTFVVGSCWFDLIDLAIRHCTAMKWEQSPPLTSVNSVRIITKIVLSLSTMVFAHKVNILVVSKVATGTNYPIFLYQP